jgi:hypothetical protein
MAKQNRGLPRGVPCVYLLSPIVTVMVTSPLPANNNHYVKCRCILIVQKELELE